MDQNNFEYLKKSLNFLGFGTHLNKVLEEGMNKKIMSFSIGFNQRYIPAEFRSNPSGTVDQMHFELRFNKSRHNDFYFFNAMEAKLIRYNNPEPVQNRFEMEKNDRLSALQAYKLLCGLSFQKDTFVLDLDTDKNKKVPLWYKLDLRVTNKEGQHPTKFFFPEYGFDLEKTFDRYPISGMQDAEKRESAIKALRFGNLISLDMKLDGINVPVYLSANPEYKMLNVYAADMKPVRSELIFPAAITGTQTGIDPGISTPSEGERSNVDEKSPGLRR